MNNLIINRKNIVVNILKFNSNIWVIDIHKPKQPTQRIWNNTKNGNNFYSFDEAKIFYKYDYDDGDGILEKDYEDVLKWLNKEPLNNGE